MLPVTINIISARSVGKTTCVEKLLPELAALGLHNRAERVRNLDIREYLAFRQAGTATAGITRTNTFIWRRPGPRRQLQPWSGCAFRLVLGR